ncbi:hypothetical protein PMAC_000516 [Pneumocystis sp. 'macacae']|nr:hypothetical protein PMAC_000516 [Pneumocystis sp. 'macacae']
MRKQCAADVVGMPAVHVDGRCPCGWRRTGRPPWSARWTAIGRCGLWNWIRGRWMRQNLLSCQRDREAGTHRPPMRPPLESAPIQAASARTSGASGAAPSPLWTRARRAAALCLPAMWGRARGCTLGRLCGGVLEQLSSALKVLACGHPGDTVVDGPFADVQIGVEEGAGVGAEQAGGGAGEVRGRGEGCVRVYVRPVDRRMPARTEERRSRSRERWMILPSDCGLAVRKGVLTIVQGVAGGMAELPWHGGCSGTGGCGSGRLGRDGVGWGRVFCGRGCSEDGRGLCAGLWRGSVQERAGAVCVGA